MGRLRLVRNSELSSYRRCRLKWWWNYERALQPKTAAPPLRFGNLVHLALERYYIPGKKRGPSPAATFVALLHEQLETHPRFNVWGDDNDDEDKRMDPEELGVAMLKHYVEEYGKDKRIEIIAPEMPFQVDVPHPKTGRYFCTVVGKLDAVYRDLSTRRIGIIDHKTARSISTSHLFMDDQAGTYFAFAPLFLRAAGLLGENERLSHILYNYLRKALPDARPRDDDGFYLNKDGSISKRQPPAYFHRERVWRDEADGKAVIQRIVEQVWEMKQLRAGKLPLYKSPSPECARCPFKDPCELHETGNDHEEMLELAYEHWDPYADHEIARKG